MYIRGTDVSIITVIYIEETGVYAEKPRNCHKSLTNVITYRVPFMMGGNGSHTNNEILLHVRLNL